MKVTIYEHAADLPSFDSESYFHSIALMKLCEQTPRHKPYMAVASDGDGTVVAHMLAIMRVRGSWIPPYLYTHARVYGIEPCDAAIFGHMLEALTERLASRALYIEISNLPQKMYGYRQLRTSGYFPVRWMNIHNSLHSRTPEERITARQQKRIEAAMERGATTKQVETIEEFEAFSRLLRRHNWLKPRRFIPDDCFFRGMMEDGRCSITVVKHHDRIIGGAVIAYSGADAYLWFSAARRKTFAPLHPNALAIWAAIKHAHAQGYDHIRFLDVGLPFRKSPYRDFILSFGGKETSSYRWFRISIKWVNTLGSWLWRE